MNQQIDKEEIYIKIQEKTGFSFDQIALMTPRQQYLMLRGSRYQTFDSIEDLQKFQAGRR